MGIFDFIDNPLEKKREWFEIREGKNFDNEKVYNVVEKCNKGCFNNIKSLYAGNFETIEKAEDFIKSIKNQGVYKTVKKIY